MTCLIERDVSKVAALLAGDSSALWAIIGSAAAPADSLICLERDFSERELSRSLADVEREDASRQARDFFGMAERADPDLRLNFSARVPLAIPDWDDVQQIFRIRALRERRPDVSIVVWLADPAMMPMLDGCGLSFSKSSRSLWPGRAIARSVRAFLRCLLNPAPGIPAGNRLWLTLGGPVGARGTDTYFGDWWHSAPGANVRIFMAAGRRLRFGRNCHEAPVEAFGSVADVLAAVSDCWCPPSPPTSLRGNYNRALWHWLAQREWSSGDMFVLAFQRRVMVRMLSRTAAATVVVPFEGRSWERNLNRLAHRQGIPVIGYQHSSITPRHLALLDAGQGWCRIDLPDRVITCGAVTAERLRAMAGAGQTELVAGAALRSTRQALPPPGDALLVAISSSRGESRAILQFLHSAVDRLQMPVIVRPHPTIPIDDLFGGLGWPSSVRISAGRSLAQDMAEAHFVAYSSSTVALEGLIHGRLPVFLDIRDVLSGDPIDDGEFKLRATSPDELVICLKDALTWSAERLDHARTLGLSYVERYLAAPSPDRLERMTTALLP